jgi:hypothetical protein
MCSIFHSILASRHKCRSCTVHGRNSVNRKSIVRTKLLSNRGCSGIAMTRKFHLDRSPNCRQLVNSRGRSNGGRIRKIQFRGRSVRGRSSLGDIDRLAGREFRSLHLAIRLYRSIGRKRNFRGRSKMDLGNQLGEGKWGKYRLKSIE